MKNEKLLLRIFIIIKWSIYVPLTIWFISSWILISQKYYTILPILLVPIASIILKKKAKIPEYQRHLREFFVLIMLLVLWLVYIKVNFDPDPIKGSEPYYNRMNSK